MKGKRVDLVHRQLVVMATSPNGSKKYFRSFVYGQSSIIPVHFAKIGLVDVDNSNIGLKEMTKTF